MSKVRFEGWEAEITPAGEGVHRIRIGGESREVRLLRREGGLIVFETEGRVVSAVVRVERGRAEVIAAGRRAVFPLEDEGGGESFREGAGHGPLRAELPGKVIEVRVSEGDRVAAGDVLLVIEAGDKARTFTRAARGEKRGERKPTRAPLTRRTDSCACSERSSSLRATGSGFSPRWARPGRTP